MFIFIIETDGCINLWVIFTFVVTMIKLLHGKKRGLKYSFLVKGN